jgi:hypothetical protein
MGAHSPEFITAVRSKEQAMKVVQQIHECTPNLQLELLSNLSNSSLSNLQLFILGSVQTSLKQDGDLQIIQPLVAIALSVCNILKERLAKMP